MESALLKVCCKLNTNGIIYSTTVICSIFQLERLAPSVQNCSTVICIVLGVVSIEAEYVETKEGTYAPVRFTVVTTRMKIIKRQKIKPEGSVRDYRVEATGLSASALADVTLTRAEMTKTLCSMLTLNTILLSFDPATDLHLMKVCHLISFQALVL